MERRRISILESFLSGGKVGRSALNVQKAALNAFWRKVYLIHAFERLSLFRRCDFESFCVFIQVMFVKGRKETKTCCKTQ